MFPDLVGDMCQKMCGTMLLFKYTNHDILPMSKNDEFQSPHSDVLPVMMHPLYYTKIEICIRTSAEAG